MAVESLTKEQARAVQYFEDKLNFEATPYGLHAHIKEGKPLTIVDLRTPELYAKGHVPGAINVSYDELEKNPNKLSKDKTVVVYCYDLLCTLAAKTALLLAQNGYTVKELAGGYDQWAKKEGSPIETSSASSCSTSKGSSCG